MEHRWPGVLVLGLRREGQPGELAAPLFPGGLGQDILYQGETGERATRCAG